MIDKPLDFALVIARRLPVGIVFGSIGVANLALLVAAQLVMGPVNLGTRVLIEIAWVCAMIYTLFTTIIGFGAILLNDERMQLIGLQRQASDLRAMSWQEFERLIADLFEKDGFHVKRRGGADPDGGVDMEFSRDGRRCLVQCKKWHWQTVGVGKVRELFGVMHAEGADEAMFVTAGVFSPDAIRFAQGKPITLMDGHQVWRKCGQPMELRGSPIFWGCSRYPICNGWRRARTEDGLADVAGAQNL
jgi:restriction system protein